jgi:proline iminopeptidase
VIRKTVAILKYAVMVIGGLVAVGLASALLYRGYLQHRVAGKRPITPRNGIDSLGRVRIGGIDQWIEVRGQNVDSPILLFIHGGPGIAFIPLANSFQGPWEKSFTVVEWDQRGAGKTYSSNDKDLQRRTMNVPQMEQDTLEVVSYLCNRFQRKKIFLVGHSWGSVLGLWMAHEHPELINAYVGVGQLLDARQNDALAYQDALQEASSAHNLQAIRDLKGIAPYPPPTLDDQKMGIARYWEGRLLGPPPSPGAFTNPRRLLMDVVSAPQYSLADDLGFIHGMSASREIFSPQLLSIHLNQLGSEFSAPIFFFEGRQDPYCRPALIWNYYQQVSAPEKGFVWFDHSGHFPFFEEPQRFTDEMVQRLLPLAN